MGVGDFLSSKAEYDYLTSERAREAWGYDNFPEGERQEMVEVGRCRAQTPILAYVHLSHARTSAATPCVRASFHRC